MTRIAGVAGRPVGHSLSPAIHRAWIAALNARGPGLDADYRAFDCADEAAFGATVDRVRRGALAGINVTAPYKEAALALADRAGATAAACGSANLLTMRDGVLIADSTDGEGLLAALAEQAPGLDLTGARVVVLGAGGAARAAVTALKAAGAEVAVLNRTATRARALAAALGCDMAGPEAAGAARLVVNATGTTPDLDVAALASDAILMDMSYRPLITPFLAEGRARGLAVVDGLAMLIGQARPSFRALFGAEPPKGVDVRAVALEATGAAMEAS